MATRQKEGWTQLPPFMVPDELVIQIENVWHDRHFPNRSEALRAIIEAGIAAMKAKSEAPRG